MSAGAGENSNANVMQVTVQDVHATKRHGVEVRLRLALSSHGERSLRQIDPHNFSGPVHRVPRCLCRSLLIRRAVTLGR